MSATLAWHVLPSVRVTPRGRRAGLFAVEFLRRSMIVADLHCLQIKDDLATIFPCKSTPCGLQRPAGIAD